MTFLHLGDLSVEATQFVPIVEACGCEADTTAKEGRYGNDGGDRTPSEPARCPIVRSLTRPLHRQGLKVGRFDRNHPLFW